VILLCVAPALAQQAGPPDQPVAAQAATDHDTYLQKTHSELSMWRARIDEFGADTKNSAINAGSDADRDLNSAWAHLQDAAARLQSAGADGWADAKAAYEKASIKVAATWHRVHPEKI
jgi:outer membrane protein TolC